MSFSALLNDPTFWVAIATALFVVVVYKPVRKFADSALQSRIDSVSKELEEAKRLKEEAQELLVEADKKLSRSEHDAKEIISHAKKEAELIILKTKEKLTKDIEIKKKIALDKIKSIEDKSVEEIKQNLTNITILAAQAILEEHSQDEKIEALTEKSVDKASKTIH